MENVIFTQLSVPEVRQLFRQELESYFESKSSGSQNEADRFLTIQQAADFLKLSVTTIYGLVSKSQLPVSKKGKRLYFLQSELTQWIKIGRKKTVAETAIEANAFVNRKAK
jgi:excisionase family DNA binding protein